MRKVKVAFICVHNSCRSQMAEALGNLFGKDVFESYSAGTETKPMINQDAVKVIKKLYDIDMNESQKSKLLEDIPKVDIVIKMGCNVVCPFLPGNYVEDWGLEDPTGKSEEEFIKTAKAIEEKVKELATKIKNNEIKY
ncbi:MAG: arsenate reductase ArsC [Sarcina sp.]